MLIRKKYNKSGTKHSCATEADKSIASSQMFRLIYIKYVEHTRMLQHKNLEVWWTLILNYLKGSFHQGIYNADSKRTHQPDDHTCWWRARVGLKKKKRNIVRAPNSSCWCDYFSRMFWSFMNLFPNLVKKFTFSRPYFLIDLFLSTKTDLWSQSRSDEQKK